MMPAALARRHPLIALTWLAALAAGAAALGGGGQAPTGRPAGANGPKPTPFIYGGRGCGQCHDQAKNPSYTPTELAACICRMTEFPIFNTSDKHRIAFKGLTGERGKQMGQILGTDVTKLEACVNCHSVPERGMEKMQYAPEVDGVTCVACHGAYKEWVLKHQIPDKEWLDLSREEKESRFGMTDLWDPARRAETCASCHIGNDAQGKVVTHAMYAAGHPPLPSFEAATFSDAQPRHWEYLREKDPRRLKRLMPVGDPKNLEGTQLVLIGGLVEFRESMKLVAGQAAANKPGPDGARWPDFARFDCYACHHELRRDEGGSWRQARYRDGSPGRPLSPDWPLLLVRLAIEVADPDHAQSRLAEFDKVLAAYEKSLRARPFGDGTTLVPAAHEAVKWADSTIAYIKGIVFDATKARSMLDRLCKMAADGIPDYDSARQMAWAFRVIYRESVPPDRIDPAIKSELDGLEAELDLDLPPARKQELIETTLSDRLKKAAQFDPASFKAHFARIADALAGKPAAAAAGR